MVFPLLNSKFRIGIYFSILILFSSCSSSLITSQRSFVFGTLVQIQIYGDSFIAREAISAIFQKLDDWHYEFHPWRAGLLRSVNLSAGEYHLISQDFFDLLNFSQDLEDLSLGLFNPALGHIIEAWGFHTESISGRFPSKEDFQSWKKMPPSSNCFQFKMDDDRIYIRSHCPEVWLDFSGILKGFSLDKARQILHSYGIQNALINIGGNVLAMGERGSQKWRVGIQHPRKSEAFAWLELEDGEAIGTSGDYQNFFIIDGVRYCHIIDPYSFSPVNNTQAALIVIPSEYSDANNGMYSDALSKPIFIGGRKTWQNQLKTFNLKLSLIWDAEGCLVSSDLMNRLSFLGAFLSLEDEICKVASF